MQSIRIYHTTVGQPPQSSAWRLLLLEQDCIQSQESQRVCMCLTCFDINFVPRYKLTLHISGSAVFACAELYLLLYCGQDPIYTVSRAPGIRPNLQRKAPIKHTTQVSGNLTSLFARIVNVTGLFVRNSASSRRRLQKILTCGKQTSPEC